LEEKNPAALLTETNKFARIRRGASEQITGAFLVLLLFQIWPVLAQLK